MSKKFITILGREVKNLLKYHRQQNEEDFLEVANYMELQLKYMKKNLKESVNEGNKSFGVYKWVGSAGKVVGMYNTANGARSQIAKMEKKDPKGKYQLIKFESIKEADLGLTYKKGKTVKVKHKTSGKSLVIIDKPVVRKEYEKIGYFAESVNERRQYQSGSQEMNFIVQQLVKYGNTKSDAIKMTQKHYNHVIKRYRNSHFIHPTKKAEIISSLSANESVKEYSGMSKWQRDRLDQRSKEKAPKGKKVSKALKKKQDAWAKKYYTKGGGINIAKWKKDGSPGFPKESVNEKVIKVDKDPHIGVRNTPKGKTFNPLLLKGEDKIKALVWSGSYPKGKGSYELKGNKLNVNGINPRDKGFYIAHFTKNTKIKRANLYYDGVHWQDKNKKF